MKKIGIVLCVAFSFITLSLQAQTNLRVYAEKQGDATVFYANNNEVAPISLKLTFVVNNLQVREDPEQTYLVPAHADHFQLAELDRVNRRKTSYSYNFSAVFGDVRQTSYDHNYAYDLPYGAGTKTKIVQGYNGTFTHQGENAIDFDMPEGTPVHAARNGIVIAVVQNFNQSCWSDACRAMANYILIMHPDGTIADYSHLLFNGARVEVGDSVRRGDLIALSGNTGYTRGPHLHFDCYLPGFDGKRTLITRFRTGDGNSSAYLTENRSYRKSYGTR